MEAHLRLMRPKHCNWSATTATTATTTIAMPHACIQRTDSIQRLKCSCSRQPFDGGGRSHNIFFCLDLCTEKQHTAAPKHNSLFVFQCTHQSVNLLQELLFRLLFPVSSSFCSIWIGIGTKFGRNASLLLLYGFLETINKRELMRF